MPFNRTSSRMAIGLLAILLASPALGQGPLGLQLFAPADVSTYGGTQEPNEGYFFQFDGLYWSVSAPESQYIGQAPPDKRLVWYSDTLERPQVSNVTTGELNAQFSPGARYEFGRVEDRNGWFVSIYQLRNQVQGLSIPSADVVFTDPAIITDKLGYLWGPVVAGGEMKQLPVTLYDLQVDHSVDTWGVELMYLHRAMTCHSGGTFELFAGARYLEFNDNFGVRAGASPAGLTVPSFLQNSWWQSTAENHVVGPEVGVKWSKKQGRWMLSTEGRFLAGLNCQNVRVKSDLGPNLDPGSGAIFMPAVMGETMTDESQYAREWSPGIELRIEARYQITRTISFHAGWTGLWLDNIARGNAVIDYSAGYDTLTGASAMGVDMTRNKQDLFMNGLTLGFDINR